MLTPGARSFAPSGAKIPRSDSAPAMLVCRPPAQRYTRYPAWTRSRIASASRSALPWKPTVARVWKSICAAPASFVQGESPSKLTIRRRCASKNSSAGKVCRISTPKAPPSATISENIAVWLCRRSRCSARIAAPSSNTTIGSLA